MDFVHSMAALRLQQQILGATLQDGSAIEISLQEEQRFASKRAPEARIGDQMGLGCCFKGHCT